MIEVSVEEYEKLVKEADDNASIIRITRIVIIGIICLVVIFTMLKPAFDVWLEEQKFENQLTNAKIEAANNKQVMDIESEGLSNEEYFKWLEVR